MSSLFSTGRRAPKHDYKKILLFGLRGSRRRNQLISAAKPLANKAKRELSPTKLKSYGENIARINYNSRKKTMMRVCQLN